MHTLYSVHTTYIANQQKDLYLRITHVSEVRMKQFLKYYSVYNPSAYNFIPLNIPYQHLLNYLVFGNPCRSPKAGVDWNSILVTDLIKCFNQLYVNINSEETFRILLFSYGCRQIQIKEEPLI